MKALESQKVRHVLARDSGLHVSNRIMLLIVRGRCLRRACQSEIQSYLLHGARFQSNLLLSCNVIWAMVVSPFSHPIYAPMTCSADSISSIPNPCLVKAEKYIQIHSFECPSERIVFVSSWYGIGWVIFGFHTKCIFRESCCWVTCSSPWMASYLRFPRWTHSHWLGRSHFCDDLSKVVKTKKRVPYRYKPTIYYE